MKHVFVRSLVVLGLATLAGCAHHPKTILKMVPCVDSDPYEPGATGFAAAPTNAPQTSPMVPAPVLKLVHRPVPPSTAPLKVYYAMVSPYPANLSTNLRYPVDARQLTYQADWATASAASSSSSGGGYTPGSTLGFAAPALVDEYQVAMMSLTLGTGWVYLTGERPIVKTKRVIGAADGTTFICQVAERDGIEYYRFGLFFPSGAPATDAVTLTGTDASGSTSVQINQTTPYAVYAYDTSTASGSWVTSATVGTGYTWDNFARAIHDATTQAALAALPVP
ncbi:MAG TPA: hypothetical protein VK176_14990 [Phycisphaerales bacterium]|nr:hypothetical protein [Phycisphaerales bacterium]